jgi:hypothetical protein
MKAPHWELRLAEAISAARHRPFAWGQHDCVTWAADTACAMLGVPSWADDWRGRYSTEIGAARHLKKLGFASLYDAGLARLGEPLANRLMAQRGDIVFARAAFGVCVGIKAAFVGQDGLEFLHLREVQAAWRL